MAYGLKYELFFSDIEGNKFKIEILKKNFELDPLGLGTQPTELVGTGKPAIIEWQADDDIYSPIIGSSCKINLFVTDTDTYEEFYRAGEREFKVRILEYTSFGGNWEDINVDWDGTDQNYDASLGAAVFYIPIWEGFLVNDGYLEAVTTTPYNLNLEAIDGLGTLDSFDVPYPSDNVNDKEKMFFYLKEILKLTGHNFDMYISNDIRIDGGATNDTIFHDIEVDRYIFSKKNLTLMNAKESLRYLLKMTNSRVFQSFGKWYIINNSSLIDNRIVQGTTAPSGGDVVNEPAEPVEVPVYGSPSVYIDGVAIMYYNTNADYRLQAIESGGTQVVEWRWYLGGVQVLVQSDPSNVDFGELHLGNVTASQDGDSYTVQGVDANGQTDLSDAFVLDVREQTVDPTGDQVDEDETVPEEDITIEDYPTAYDLRINASAYFNVVGAHVSPQTGILSYGASEAGTPFTMEFNVISNTGEFTSASQLTTVSVTGGFNVSHALQGDFIKVTITGNRPVGTQTQFLTLKGGSVAQQFTHSYTVTDNVTNGSISPSTFSAVGGDGTSYTKTFEINASTDYEWQSSGNVSVIANSSPYDTLLVSKINDTTLRVTITGSIGVTDESIGITVTGEAVGSGVATSISITPSAPYDVSQGGGYFDLRVTSNGNFTATPNVSWITLSRTQGYTGDTIIRVSFSINNDGRTRRGSVNFTQTGTTNQITSILINQEGVS